MKQVYSLYTEDHHKVWKTLFHRQTQNLENKACSEYLECLDQLSPVLNGNAIPDFEALNEVLRSKTGWSIEVVPGLIPVEDFLHLLAGKRFCSSTWIRSMDKLDYLEEPDIFHDIYGHIPLLINPKYSQFANDFGKLGVKYHNYPRIISQLQRLYWFTIEFGVLQSRTGRNLYGAGIISSHSETGHVLASETKIIPFDLPEVLEHDFINTEIQQCYYAIEHLEDLNKLIPQLDHHFEQILKTKRLEVCT